VGAELFHADRRTDTHDVVDSRFLLTVASTFSKPENAWILRESNEKCWHFSRFFFFVTYGTAVVRRVQLHWGGNPTCVWLRNASPNQTNFEVTGLLSSNFMFCVSVWASFRANMAVVRAVGSERMLHEKYDL